jgi:hypothetical protein
MFDFTDFARKEETLSRTKAFNLRRSAALSADAISFISVLLMGLIGSHMDITSKAARTASEEHADGLVRNPYDFS